MIAARRETKKEGTACPKRDHGVSLFARALCKRKLRSVLSSSGFIVRLGYCQKEGLFFTFILGGTLVVYVSFYSTSKKVLPLKKGSGRQSESFSSEQFVGVKMLTLFKLFSRQDSRIYIGMCCLRLCLWRIESLPRNTMLNAVIFESSRRGCAQLLVS